MIDYGGIWVNLFSLIDFMYDNRYHFSIGLALFEALKCKRCTSPIRWLEVGKAEKFDLDLVH